MKVLLVPKKLRNLAFGLYLSLPAAVIELAIYRKSPVWKLSSDQLSFVAVVFLVALLSITFFILRGRRMGLILFQGLAFSWISITLYLAWRTQHLPLGFFFLFLVTYLVGMGFLLCRELRKSYFNPLLRWYELRPKPIPHLNCLITSPENLEPRTLRACRFDEWGTFLFSKFPIDFIKAGLILHVKFTFRDKEVSCQGVPIRLLNGSYGVGIQFLEFGTDLKKDFLDFLERVRSEGYV